jgi:hypothetical protein
MGGLFNAPERIAGCIHCRFALAGRPRQLQGGRTLWPGLSPKFIRKMHPQCRPGRSPARGASRRNTRVTGCCSTGTLPSWIPLGATVKALRGDLTSHRPTPPRRPQNDLTAADDSQHVHTDRPAPGKINPTRPRRGLFIRANRGISARGAGHSRQPQSPPAPLHRHPPG